MRRRTRVSPDEQGKEKVPAKNSDHFSSFASSCRALTRSDIKMKTIPVHYTELPIKRKVDFVRLRYIPQKCCQVIHPNGLYRRGFDFFTVIWVLVLVFVVPFQIGFDWYKLSKAQKICLNLLDVWFGIDIVLNFRTGYICHGTVVLDGKKIIKNYTSTWFLIDVLGTFPFELVLDVNSASSRKSLKLIKYFKIPKLLRISRLMKYIREKKSVYDIVQVFVLVFTFLHIGACLWMLILSPCSDLDSGLNQRDTSSCSQENVSRLYIESFHLSAAMMLGVSNSHVIGDSTTLDMLTSRRETDRILMYAISTLFMVGGLFLIALLISELNVFITGKKQGNAIFQQKFDRVKHEMEYYSVPDDLQLQVKAFYDYIWIHQKQYDDRIALLSDDQMSTDLKRKLALHLYKEIVSHISIFSDIDDLLLGEICLSLRTRIFLPSDMILFKGDVGKELFIIAKGVVEVLRDDLPYSERMKSPPIFLDNGCFFGEIALIMETKRTCSVQAHTICEVNILQQQTFDTILRENSRFARRMNELVVARQLEKSMSKRINELSTDRENEYFKGDPDDIDFRVSRKDMHTAILVVEENMKRGLSRRMREETIRDDSNTHSSSTYTTTDQSSQSPQHQNKIIDQSPRISFVDTVDSAHDISHTMRFSNLRPRLDEVTKVIDDIANRSTRVKCEDNSSPSIVSQRRRSSTTGSINSAVSLRKLSRKIDHSLDGPKFSSSGSDKKLNKDEIIALMSSVDNSKKDILTCSHEETTTISSESVALPPTLPSTKEFPPQLHSSAEADAIVYEEIEDSENMLVTGNLNLSKARVDIDKIHRSILKSDQHFGQDNFRPRVIHSCQENSFTNIELQLKAQGSLLQDLLGRIDSMKSQKKED